MSNPCAASNCLNGNCPGCRNGVLYCNDPRCYPKCTGCDTKTDNNSNWILITVILVLLVILLILSFVIGYGWFTDRKKASEPKKITVNRNVHSFTTSPPSVPISSSVSPSSVSPSSLSSPAPISSSLSVPEPSISYDGVNLSMEGLASSGNNSSISIKSNCNDPIQGLE